MNGPDPRPLDLEHGVADLDLVDAGIADGQKSEVSADTLDLS